LSTTTAQLDQDNDTKDLTWVQRPLTREAKLVDKPVLDFDTTHSLDTEQGSAFATVVHNAEFLHCSAARSQQVFQNLPLKEAKV
jgi:hypothetical protein